MGAEPQAEGEEPQAEEGDEIARPEAYAQGSVASTTETDGHDDIAASPVFEMLPGELHAFERRLAEYAASIEQAHVQLAQSRPESKVQAHVSQTTRNVMAKRALGSLEEVGASLVAAAADAGRLRAAAGALREECVALEREREAAQRTAARALEESSSLAQVSDASQAEISRRTAQSTRELAERLEATSAEARLLNELNDKLRAESNSARAARDAAEARAAKAEAVARAADDAA
ncbi:hypothetical protein T492DRAFT_859276, partial [Pavlovales sp. CCMP2436]